MAGGAQDEDFFLTGSHGGLLGVYEFHGAGGSGRRPRPRRTVADGPQAEERAIAADAHRFRVTNFCFLFFSPRL